MDLSIIVPIRNAEPFIRRCAHSLFAQTLPQGVEYIFIDDGCTDRSIDILQEVMLEYPGRLADTRVLHHRRPQGNSAARNTGIANATADFVAFCDADDWLEETFAETMIAQARWSGADIVVCDYIEEYWGRKIIRKQQPEPMAEDFLIQLLSGQVSEVVWNKLVKRSLLTANDLRFPEGINMGEDLILSVEMTMKCATIAYAPHTLYHFNRENPESLTMKMDDRSIEDLQKAYAFLEELARTDATGKIAEALPFRKLLMQLKIMRHASERTSRIWARKNREYIPYIMRHPAWNLYWRIAMRLNHAWGYRWFRAMAAMAR